MEGEPPKYYEILAVENGMTVTMIKTMYQNNLSKIQPDSWYNIPICVVKAFQILVEHCQSLTQIIKEINERDNEREKNSQLRVKKLEATFAERDIGWHRIMEVSEKSILEKVKKLQYDVDLGIA